MSYATEQAKLLADTLGRIATANAHQLVGHRDNLAFWLDEVVHAVAVLKGYNARFRRMKAAEVQWVRAHDVKVPHFCRICAGPCEFGPQTPNPPRRVPSRQIDESIVALREACRCFLLRLYRGHMLSEDELIGVADQIGTGSSPTNSNARNSRHVELTF